MVGLRGDTAPGGLRRSSSLRSQASSIGSGSGIGGEWEAFDVDSSEEWMHPMLQLCSVMSGNVVWGGAGNVWGRTLQAFLHLFAWLYPVIQVVGCLLVSDASGEPIKWDVYVWLVSFVMMAILPYTVRNCYSTDAVCVLVGLRREAASQEEFIERQVTAGKHSSVGVEFEKRAADSIWTFQPFLYALVFAPQVIFLVYLYFFFVSPVIRSTAGLDTTQRDTILNSSYLLRGEGRDREIMGSLRGPGVLALLGVLHCLRIMLVWFALMETIFLSQIWINACCGSVGLFMRAVRLDADLGGGFLSAGRDGMTGETYRGLEGQRWEDGGTGSPPANGRLGESVAGVAPHLPQSLHRSLHAFSVLKVGVHSMDALLAVPMTLILLVFVMYFLVSVAIFYDGRGGDTQWIMFFTSGTILVATVLLLGFIGSVADGWGRTVNEVVGVDVTFALDARVGKVKTANLQDSVRRTKVGFQILNIVISTQSIIWLFVYLTILIVSSGILVNGTLEDL